MPATQMEDVVQRPAHVDVLRDVLVDEREIRHRQQMLDVPHVACDEVVHGDDLEAVTHEPFTQVGAQEACASGDQYAFCRIHVVVGLGRPMLW